MVQILLAYRKTERFFLSSMLILFVSRFFFSKVFFRIWLICKYVDRFKITILNGITHFGPALDSCIDLSCSRVCHVESTREVQQMTWAKDVARAYQTQDNHILLNNIPLETRPPRRLRKNMETRDLRKLKAGDDEWQKARDRTSDGN